ncbi:MAG: hypothetical protein J0H93_00520 [Chlamydiales bacterium]|nr:hypothetical protein [Chlamydiales bacterium]
MFKSLFRMLLTALMFVNPIWGQEDVHFHEETSDANLLINLTTLTPENLKDFLAERNTPFILECPEGSIIPINIYIKGDFLDQESTTTLNLKIRKTCYIKHFHSTLIFSLDKINWRDFQEFFTGSIGVLLNHTRDCAELGLSLELNQRG